MERLTERNPYWLGEEFWVSAREPDEDEIDKVYERLKHYEDLQEQLEKTYGDCDGLLETVVDGLVKHDGVDVENPIKSRLLTDDCAEKWLRWKNADEQGRLLELPCMVGDTVFYEMTYSSAITGVQPYQITNIMISQNKQGQWTKKYRAMLLMDGKIVDSQLNFSFEDLGKTVFLTHEEAENTLEGKTE